MLRQGKVHTRSMGSHLQIFTNNIQAKPQQTGGIGPMCYNVLFLMIPTKALSHSLRATICNWALGTMACIGHPPGPRYVACDCFLYLFQACMRQAPIVERTPATCGSLRAHYSGGPYFSQSSGLGATKFPTVVLIPDTGVGCLYRTS